MHRTPSWPVVAAVAALGISAFMEAPFSTAREAARAIRFPLAVASGDAASSRPWRDRGPFSRPRVGLQAGHWRIAELPDELAHLRANTGTSAAGVPEVELNLEMARLTAAELEKAGVLVDLLPATIPIAYDADAFLAIHADGGDSGNRGWKIAAPWRPSPASNGLRDALAAAYAARADLPEDRLGVTMQMRGYYAFGWSRYRHAVAPTTPAAIVETGFLTSSADRSVIVGDPGSIARRLAEGILLFLDGRPARPASAYAPKNYPAMTVAAAEAALRAYPSETASAWAVIPAGTVVRPLDERDGWFQLMMRAESRVLGWMKRADLRPSDGG